MKIKELIELLQKHDPEEIVYIIGGFGTGDPLSEDSVGITTRLVWDFVDYKEVSCFGIYGE